MFAIVKSCEGWTVVEDGRVVAVEASLLSAFAIKAHLESGSGPDPEEHTLAVIDELCSCYEVIVDGQHIDTVYCDHCRDEAPIVPRAVSL